MLSRSQAELQKERVKKARYAEDGEYVAIQAPDCSASASPVTLRAIIVHRIFPPLLLTFSSATRQSVRSRGFDHRFTRNCFSMSFSTLGLTPSLSVPLARLGYQAPTP